MWCFWPTPSAVELIQAGHYRKAYDWIIKKRIKVNEVGLLHTCLARGMGDGDDATFFWALMKRVGCDARLRRRDLGTPVEIAMRKEMRKALYILVVYMGAVPERQTYLEFILPRGLRRELRLFVDTKPGLNEDELCLIFLNHDETAWAPTLRVGLRTARREASGRRREALVVVERGRDEKAVVATLRLLTVADPQRALQIWQGRHRGEDTSEVAEYLVRVMEHRAAMACWTVMAQLLWRRLGRELLRVIGDIYWEKMVYTPSLMEARRRRAQPWTLASGPVYEAYLRGRTSLCVVRLHELVARSELVRTTGHACLMRCIYGSGAFMDLEMESPVWGCLRDILG